METSMVSILYPPIDSFNTSLATCIVNTYFVEMQYARIFFFYENVQLWRWRWKFLHFLQSEAENVRKMFLNLHGILCIRWWLMMRKLFWNRYKLELVIITDQNVCHAIRKPLLLLYKTCSSTAHDFRVISARTWARAHTKWKRFPSNWAR